MDLGKLERLASLRDSGAITQEEFEAEKAKLLPQTEQYEPSDHYEDPPRRAGKIIGGTLAVLLVGGAAAMYASGQIGVNDILPASVTSPVKSALASGGTEWGFATGTDPMTDAEVVAAKRRIDAGEYLVDAQVTCTGRTRLQYEFVILRKDETGDAIAQETRTHLNGMPYVSRTYDIRLDSGPSVTETVTSRHSNSIVTDSSDTMGASADNSQRMAAARMITIKVPMLHNDLTFEVPQTDSRIRQFLDSCHKADPNSNFVPSEEEQVPEPASEQISAPPGTSDEQPQTNDAVQPEGNSDL